jgi:hypothetical protein
MVMNAPIIWSIGPGQAQISFCGSVELLMSQVWCTSYALKHIQSYALCHRAGRSPFTPAQHGERTAEIAAMANGQLHAKRVLANCCQVVTTELLAEVQQTVEHM